MNLPEDAFSLDIDNVQQHTLSDDCWCKPRFKVPCTECEASAEGCWRCEKGWRTISRAESELHIGIVLVAHNDSAPS